MAESNKDSDRHENIFEIIDGTLAQLNKTKKMFVVMILTILILPPIALMVTVAVFDATFPERLEEKRLMIEELEQLAEEDFPQEQVEIIRERLDAPSGFSFLMGPQLIIFVISIVWLGVGIRQWVVLSRWSKKYEKYKKRQEEIDKKLLDDEGKNNSSG